jgi:hypothetical protein
MLAAHLKPCPSDYELKFAIHATKTRTLKNEGCGTQEKNVTISTFSLFLR